MLNVPMTSAEWLECAAVSSDAQVLDQTWPGADMRGESDEQIKRDFADGRIWTLVGLLVGGVLAFKALSALDVRKGEQLSLPEYLIALALFVGPCFALTMISGHLRKNVNVGQSADVAYWAKMTGFSVAALTLASITNVGNLIGFIK